MPRRYTHQQKFALVTENDRCTRPVRYAEADCQRAWHDGDKHHNWRNARIEPLTPSAPDQPRVLKIYTRRERDRFVREIEGMRAGGHYITSACRKLGISDTAYWRLKQMLAEQALNLQAMKASLGKNGESAGLPKDGAVRHFDLPSQRASGLRASRHLPIAVPVPGSKEGRSRSLDTNACTCRAAYQIRLPQAAYPAALRWL